MRCDSTWSRACSSVARRATAGRASSTTKRRVQAPKQETRRVSGAHRARARRRRPARPRPRGEGADRISGDGDVVDALQRIASYRRQSFRGPAAVGRTNGVGCGSFTGEVDGRGGRAERGLKRLPVMQHRPTESPRGRIVESGNRRHLRFLRSTVLEIASRDRAAPATRRLGRVGVDCRVHWCRRCSGLDRSRVASSRWSRDHGAYSPI